jgi:hypothetical protein
MMSSPFTRLMLLLLLSGGGTVAAQQADPMPVYLGHERLEPANHNYLVTGQFVPLYTAGDTLNAARHAAQGERLLVQGLGPNWAQVVIKQKYYFLRKQFLNLPDALQTIPDSLAVPRDLATGLVRYTGEATAPGTQAELMGRAKVWFATGFRTKEVMQVQDAATGALVGKAFSEVFIQTSESAMHRLDYIIQVTCHDGGYRYSISSFAFGQYLGSYGGASGTPAERLIFAATPNGKQRTIALKHKTELYRVAQELQQQLRAAMSKPVGS